MRSLWPGADSESAPKDGLCYIIPRYEPSQAEHFAHLPTLLDHVGSEIPLAVIIEKGSAPPHLGRAQKVLVLQHGSAAPIRRARELFEVLRQCGREGYRNVFIRYSRLAATIVILFRRVLKMRLWYWASERADIDMDKSPSKTARRMVASRHLQWIVRRADHFVTGPESMVDYATRRWSLPPGKVRLLYNDVDTERFRPASVEQRAAFRKTHGWSDGEFIVLFVHRLAPRKGSSLLVPIAEELARRFGPPFKIVGIGDGPELPRLIRQREVSPARESLHLVGSVANLELPPWYQAADCFLMPSYTEGFPRVILEAMASGLPVVSTRAGGTTDVVGSDYPFLADPGDVVALAGHLTTMASDPTTREEWADRLRQRARSRFDTKIVASMLVRLITHG